MLLIQDIRNHLPYFASNGFWLLLTQAVSVLSAFIVTVLLARLLPQETFGQYRFALSMMPLLAVFTLPGIATALTRSVAQKRRSDLRKIVRTKIMWGLLSMLVTLALSLYYAIQGNTPLSNTLSIMAVLLPLYDAFSLYVAYYKGHQDFKTPALYEMLTRVLQGASIIGVTFFTHSLAILILTALGSQIVVQFFAYRHLLPDMLQRVHLYTNKDDTVAYGKQLTPVTLLSIGNATIDKIFIWHVLGAIPLSVYIVVLILTTQTTQIINLFNQLIFTKVAQISSGRPLTLLTYKPQILLFAGVLLVAAAVCAPVLFYIFPHIFPAYSEYAYYIFLTMPLIVLVPVRDMFFQIFVAQGSHRGMSLPLMGSIAFYTITAYLYAQSLTHFFIILIAKEVLTIVLILCYASCAKRTETTKVLEKSGKK